MIASIDMGASLVKVVTENTRNTYKTSEFSIELVKAKEIVLTGGKSKNLPYKSVDEMEAIVQGALLLTKYKEALVVSLGTGTAIVSSKNGHIGGTSVGGGTLMGLARNLLNTEDINKITKLAHSQSGSDLTVKDIIGGSIGNLPAEATASNLFNLTKKNSAFGIMNLVAETVATTALLSFKSTNHSIILFTGTLSENTFIQERISKLMKMFETPHEFVQDGRYSTAMGALDLYKNVKTT